MKRVTQSQPPENTDVGLKAWLSRLNGSINGSINSMLFDTHVDSHTELFAISSADQIPAGLDIPLQIEFGIPITDNGIFNLDPDGTITCLVKGYYEFDYVCHLERVQTAQDALLIFWNELNGVSNVASLAVSLDGLIGAAPFTSLFQFDLEVGDEIKIFMVRDGAGFDDGFLTSYTPSLGSVPPVEGAILRVRRWRLRE